jgi:hypothetical protein
VRLTASEVSGVEVLTPTRASASKRANRRWPRRTRRCAVTFAAIAAGLKAYIRFLRNTWASRQIYHCGARNRSASFTQYVAAIGKHASLKS